MSDPGRRLCKQRCYPLIVGLKGSNSSFWTEVLSRRALFDKDESYLSF